MNDYSIGGGWYLRAFHIASQTRKTMCKQWIFIFFFGVVAIIPAKAQSVELDSVTIIEKNFYGLHIKPGVQDSLFLTAIPDRLSQITTGQIRQNTPGGLSTFLFRGFSNRHIPVLWNGLNIQSMTNGSFDLNLLPAFTFQQVAFSHDIPSSITGNNTFAGGWLLESKKEDMPLLTLQADAGNMKNYGGNAGLHLKGKKTILNLGVIHRLDRNIFYYDSLDSRVERKATDFTNTHIGGEIRHQFTDTWSAGADIWYQNGKRNILNDTIFPFSDAIQSDKNIRAHVMVGYQAKKFHLKLSSAASSENLVYEDRNPGFPIRSEARVTAIQNALQFFQKDFSPFHFYLRHRFDQAETDFFDDTKRRNTWQAGGAWYTEWPNDGTFRLSTRQDVVDGKIQIPSVHLTMGHYGFIFQFYNNYQLPNFNDLFYPVTGNPDLKTESAINAEIGKSFKFGKSVLRAEVFGHWIHNLIQWIPTDSAGWIWSPFNQENVFSRGVEVSYDGLVAFKRSTLTYRASYGFTAAEISKHASFPELEGKQLIYMPRHKIQASVGYHQGKHALRMEAEQTGKRFTNADNSQSLPGFLLLHFMYSYRVGPVTMQVNLRNIFNHRYQLVNGFPMPGINGNLVIQYVIP